MLFKYIVVAIGGSRYPLFFIFYFFLFQCLRVLKQKWALIQPQKIQPQKKNVMQVLLSTHFLQDLRGCVPARCCLSSASDELISSRCLDSLLDWSVQVCVSVTHNIKNDL